MRTKETKDKVKRIGYFAGGIAGVLFTLAGVLYVPTVALPYYNNSPATPRSEKAPMAVKQYFNRTDSAYHLREYLNNRSKADSNFNASEAGRRTITELEDISKEASTFSILPEFKEYVLQTERYCANEKFILGGMLCLPASLITLYLSMACFDRYRKLGKKRPLFFGNKLNEVKNDREKRIE